MDVEELTVGVADLNLVQSPRKKRKLKRTNRGCPNLGQMPVEVLETIFLVLDPQTVCAATAVSRRFAYIGTNLLSTSLIYPKVAFLRRPSLLEGEFGGLRFDVFIFSIWR